MDFTKLNLEFSNMQNIVNKYNVLLENIKNKIKKNNKELLRLETKFKNTKKNIEKEYYNMMIISLKDEIVFLNNLIKEEDKDGKNN